MTSYFINILSIDRVTHDVVRIKTTKPGGYAFIPGQATELSIGNEPWLAEKRPFSFTNLPEENCLEFIIKIYPEHKGVTAQLMKLLPGDPLLIGEPWGAISYKGPGLFIAGGAGITPFISIFRQLRKEKRLLGNKLIFANKRKRDIILEEELHEFLGDNMVTILSEETRKGYLHGFVSKSLLETYAGPGDMMYYVCGPPPMMATVLHDLSELGLAGRSVVTEI